ncbi:uncharacterized protein At3g17950 [Humulus lupulus]|uniref:uncharacterized protein At3g17950 n=1 Tax=Humulus lupulus TaxID=3486 RepID=UPI002B40D6C0|nr:uncharacterized protein At3g17950 [Humulus lupulus]
MLDPANDLLPPPSSPTNSSISSSDLDTESTGSFFHDRSTTLGTLMGVSFPAIAFRNPSQRHRETPLSAVVGSAADGRALNGSRRCKKSKDKKNATSSAAMVVAERRRRWWSLCRDEEDARPAAAAAASLGDFLEVERRFGDGAVFYGAAAELEGVMVDQPRNGRLLFADGRVLPPAENDETTSSPSSSTAAVLCSRFPASLTGICCTGGAG